LAAERHNQKLVFPSRYTYRPAPPTPLVPQSRAHFLLATSIPTAAPLVATVSIRSIDGVPSAATSRRAIPGIGWEFADGWED